MATQPKKDLKVGTIIDVTVGVIERNMKAALIYIGGLTVLGTIFGYTTATPPDQISAGAAFGSMISGLVMFVVGVVASYLLIETLLRQMGLFARDDKERDYLPYLGQSILVGLGVAVGIILLIIPGLFFAARWSIAQQLLIGRGRGATEAMSESWERTKGYEVPIILAGLVMLALFIGAAIAVAVMLPNDGLFAIVISQLANHTASVIMAAMGVALFGLLAGTEDVAEVFE